MKKFSKIVVLALLLIGSSAIEAYSSCVITIRIARHRDCLGFGFCRMKVVVTIDGDIATEDPKATLDVTSQRKLMLTLNKSTDMSPEVFDKYFSKGAFLCEDDFPVPGDVLKAVGLDTPYTIKAGSYPIKIKGDLISIVF